jgi:hypothetical protein
MIFRTRYGYGNDNNVQTLRKFQLTYGITRRKLKTKKKGKQNQNIRKTLPFLQLQIIVHSFILVCI